MEYEKKGSHTHTHLPHDNFHVVGRSAADQYVTFISAFFCVVCIMDDQNIHHLNLHFSL